MSNINDRIDRLMGSHPFGLFVVNENKVDANRLRYLRPGAVILVDDVDAIRFIPAGDAPAIGCIAGWISEGDE